MFDIVQSANKIFHSEAASCSEILREFSVKYNIKKTDLPEKQALALFINEKPTRDQIEITITSDTDTVFISDSVEWIDKYDEFIQSIYKDAELAVNIKVKKSVTEGKLSIYNLEKFSDFLCGLKITQVFINFTNLFSDCGNHIVLQLMNVRGSLRTNSIAFSDADVQWVEKQSREDLLRKCNEASVFLERNKIRLVPQDFEIQGTLEGTGFNRIVSLFRKMRTILAYIYLANTSSINRNVAMLQFNPADRAYEYELEHLAGNNIVPEIYDWIFREENSVDKAAIARTIINTYCRNKESILSIDERILNSVKSDYVIYQKNHVDQYIDMKNRISDYIADSAEKIQSLAHDISDAFRNNLVAVLVFLMTVLLTDSLDFTQLSDREPSTKIIWVCVVFTVATILYLIVTNIMGNQKWEWLKQSYDDLKNNYEGVFVEEDIKEAFRNDEPLNNVEKQYKSIRHTITKYWIILIIVMTVFTGVLIWQECKEESQQLQIDDSVSTDVSDLLSEISISENNPA